MFPRPIAILLLAAALTTAGCVERREPAPVVFRGTAPGGGQVAAVPAPRAIPEPVAPAAGADARGVVDYGGYRAVAARPGDTVETMAARAGVSGSALAAYNGLPSGFSPRPGDELILPPTPGGGGVETAALDPVAPVAAVVEPPAVEAPVEAQVAAVPETPPAPAASTSGFDLNQIEAAIGGAPAQPVAPTPPAAAAQPTPPAEAAAPVVAALPTPAAPPPPPPAAKAPARFAKPVDGAIVRPFSRASGGARNDGVDFGAAAGSQVRAAANGQVALVSESLGGLGTIVLIRHEGDLLTVYGRVDGVQVKKGDRVTKGQTIGAVAPAGADAEPKLHFEVRQGAESVDPADFLPG